MVGGRDERPIRIFRIFRIRIVRRRVDGSQVIVLGGPTKFVNDALRDAIIEKKRVARRPSSGGGAPIPNHSIDLRFVLDS